MNKMKWTIMLLGCALFQIVAAQEKAETISLTVEPNHSTVGFAISIAGFTKVTGKFNEFNIDMEYVNGDITESSIKAVIQAASINTGIKDRDDHLRTADFFDVEKYPTITFESKRIIPFENRYLAEGTFTMHGVSKEILLPFEMVKQDGNTIGFRSETVINRIDYGVAADFQHTSMPDFLSEEIEVSIYFWTKKKKTDQ